MLFFIGNFFWIKIEALRRNYRSWRRVYDAFRSVLVLHELRINPLRQIGFLDREQIIRTHIYPQCRYVQFFQPSFVPDGICHLQIFEFHVVRGTYPERISDSVSRTVVGGHGHTRIGNLLTGGIPFGSPASFIHVFHHLPFRSERIEHIPLHDEVALCRSREECRYLETLVTQEQVQAES